MSFREDGNTKTRGTLSYKTIGPKNNGMKERQQKVFSILLNCLMCYLNKFTFLLALSISK